MSPIEELKEKIKPIAEGWEVTEAFGVGFPARGGVEYTADFVLIRKPMPKELCGWLRRQPESEKRRIRAGRQKWRDGMKAACAALSDTLREKLGDEILIVRDGTQVTVYPQRKV
jgi:hypothetical protein